MFSEDRIQDVIGSQVKGADGDDLGKVGQIYLDDETGRPEWATVRTGLFGTSETFVPLTQSDYTENGLTVPYTKDVVKGAPKIDDEDGHLSKEQEAELYRYYGLSYTGGTDADYSGQRTGGEYAEGQSAPLAGTRTDGDTTRDFRGADADAELVLSEERLNVATETREAGRARLRKYVVTEEQTVTVPVTREEVRLERQPITDGEAVGAVDLGEESADVVLTEERVVVNKETVPVERVRLETEQVTENQKVTEEIRKEKVDTDSLDVDVDADRR